MKKEDFINKTTPIYVCILLILIALLIRNVFLYKEFIKKIDEINKDSYLVITTSKEVNFYNNDNIKSIERITYDFYYYLVDKNLTENEIIIYKDEKTSYSIGDKITLNNIQNIEFIIKDFYTTSGFNMKCYVSKEMFDKLIKPDKYEYLIQFNSWYKVLKSSRTYGDYDQNSLESILVSGTEELEREDFLKSSTAFLFLLIVLDVIVYIINAIRHKKARIEEAF